MSKKGKTRLWGKKKTKKRAGRGAQTGVAHRSADGVRSAPVNPGHAEDKSELGTRRRPGKHAPIQRDGRQSAVICLPGARTPSAAESQRLNVCPRVCVSEWGEGRVMGRHPFMR